MNYNIITAGSHLKLNSVIRGPKILQKHNLSDLTKIFLVAICTLSLHFSSFSGYKCKSLEGLKNWNPTSVPGTSRVTADGG